MTVRIAIGGDFAVNDGLAAPVRDWIAGAPATGLEALRDVFAATDFRVINFEASIPDGSGPVDAAKILVRGGEQSIRGASALGIDAASLANNHAFDFGPGVRPAFEASGISCFGGGRNSEIAAQPLVCTIRNRAFALVGWADRETIHGVWAAADRIGANAAPREELIEQVRLLAREVDRVVVLPHWGRDYLRFPSPAMRDLGRRLIEAGAAAVVGTHPHVIGCRETHLGAPIVYSTGSLLLDDILRPDGTIDVAFPPCVSLVVLLDFGQGSTGIEFATFRCARGRFDALPSSRGRAILERNSRFLSAPDYARRYARYEARMEAWGLRLHNDLLSRPGAAARRLGRKLRRHLFGTG